ncbi:hypothetical protein O9K63_02000 [Janibacter cremeus]|uniref:hypothetical protein n=1 Tax=Janibacter cremeus TaxID=1285192 RepID=UPI0023F6846F|nr:hypothetical protein [Janibacter cremeus]WEV78592.1 hypothetical protein O9K63_02000 [Janibacter cremeus]
MDTARSSVVAPGPVMIALGCVAVVLGGLVAAFTGPLDWAKGSWAAAYLVLVVGAAQYVMGRMRPAGRRPDRTGWAQLAGWDLGSLLVIGGTLVATPVLVDLGSALLVAALALALLADLRAPERAGAWGTWAYRAMLLVLLASIPVGIVLSHLRN